MRKVAAFLLLAPLLLSLAGCGGAKARPLSIDEYYDRMLETQDVIIQSVSDSSDSLGSINQPDYYQMIDLENVLLDTAGVFKNAKRDAVAMNTPPEVEDAQKESIAYYSLGEDVVGEIASDVAFFRDVLPMLTDVRNLALANMVDNADLARIKAAAAEDASTMHSYDKDLNGMNPPPGLEPYKETLINFFHSIENGVADVDRAITPEDRSDFLQFKQDFEGILHQRDLYITRFLAFFMDFRIRLDYLVDAAMNREAKFDYEQ
ncbi:MAG: hypothetical protein A2V52_02800 [Actinobacteria bacterium RBG_19FT_COMBO_54_7]|nr:MAG: hypothetical protein A2V52_02800 [Actinobacteria bacterium RBG_19FT_COMBO_54_7]